MGREGCGAPWSAGPRRQLGLEFWIHPRAILSPKGAPPGGEVAAKEAPGWGRASGASRGHQGRGSAAAPSSLRAGRRRSARGA